MGGVGPRALLLDAGALIAFEKEGRSARELVRQALRRGATVIVPAPVLAQVWRDPRRQAPLARLIGSETTRVDSLDLETAKAVGVICGKSGTADVVDASVVVSARLHGATVVTSDPADLLRIDPALNIEQP